VIESLRHAGSLIFLGLAIVFVLVAIFRDGWKGLFPAETKETMAFIALGCLGVAYLLAPQTFR
jgi:hypothetical protein